jgi:hypothetical protein
MVKSADFMLADAKTTLKRAYSICFMHPKLKEEFIAWQGFVNMCKPQMQMQGKVFCIVFFLNAIFRQ